MIRRFQQAAAASPSHGRDTLPPEVKIFVIKPGLNRLLFERIPARDLAASRRLSRMREIEKEATVLRAQIKRSFEDYLRGDVRPVDEFMAELEAELNTDSVG